MAVAGVLATCAAPLQNPEDTALIRKDETATLIALYAYADQLRSLDGNERLREIQVRAIDDADSCREPRKHLELALLLSDTATMDLARARRLLAGCLNVVPGPLLAAYIRSRLDVLAQIEHLAREADRLRGRIETLETQIKELSSIEKNLQSEVHSQ